MRRLRAAATAYSRHACSELAAAIAYRILFSLVPFLALLAAVLDAALSESARADVIGWLLSPFPGTTVEADVQRELADAGAMNSLAGLVALVTLLWTASSMTRSLRVALAIVWETDGRPTFVRGKLRDAAALGVLAALIVGAFVLSLVTQIAVQAGADLTAAIGLGDIVARTTELTVVSAATFAALVLVYRLGAPVELALKDVWAVAAITAIAIDLGLAAYAFYLVNIAGLDTVHGPLGAILAFLALVYTAAALVLLGAELIATGGAGPPPDPNDG